MHGQFVWYELTTPDVDAAKKFYPLVAGWGTQQFDKDYAMWTNGGVPFAGIFRLSGEQQQQGIPPNWMPYIEAGNVDATAKQATALGGAVVHGPEDIPETGRFAVLKDPQGAMFGIYKSNGKSQSWDGSQVLGRFSWHELMTSDLPKAFEFYSKLFGWEKNGEMDMGGGEMYLMYGKPKMYGGMFNRPSAMATMPPFWLCYIFVKDVAKAVDTAVKAGGSLKRGPMDIPGGTIAILGDPQGAGFAVHAMTGPAPSLTPAASKPKAKAAAKKKTVVKKAAAKKKPVAKKAAKKAAKKPAAKKATRKKPAAKKKARAKK